MPTISRARHWRDPIPSMSGDWAGLPDIDEAWFCGRHVSARLIQIGPGRWKALDFDSGVRIAGPGPLLAMRQQVEAREARKALDAATGLQRLGRGRYRKWRGDPEAGR